MRIHNADILLFITTSLIWGTTWIAIQYQLGQVPEAWSVVYRFALASTILFIYCKFTKRCLIFSARQHIYIALQGLFLFCLNYLLFYHGSEYLLSGIVALLFSAIVLCNLFNSWLLLGSRISTMTLLGSAIGLGGIVITIISELHSVPTQGHVGYQQTSMGLLLCGAAIYVASLGNIVATRNQHQGLPIIQTNAYGMAYGAMFALLLNLLHGQAPVIDWSWHYLGSLIYLSIFGSIFAFGAYVKLLHNIGPERAVYTFILVPFIAMIISTYFENFVWHPAIVVGLVLAAIGNVLVLRK